MQTVLKKIVQILCNVFANSFEKNCAKLIFKQKFQANLEHAAVAVIVGEGVKGVIRFHQVNVLLMKIIIIIIVTIIFISKS